MTLEELRELRTAYETKKGGFGIVIPGFAMHEEVFDLAEAHLSGSDRCIDCDKCPICGSAAIQARFS